MIREPKLSTTSDYDEDPEVDAKMENRIAKRRPSSRPSRPSRMSTGSPVRIPDGALTDAINKKLSKIHAWGGPSGPGVDPALIAQVNTNATNIATNTTNITAINAILQAQLPMVLPTGGDDTTVLQAAATLGSFQLKPSATYHSGAISFTVAGTVVLGNGANWYKRSNTSSAVVSQAADNLTITGVNFYGNSANNADSISMLQIGNSFVGSTVMSCRFEDVHGPHLLITNCTNVRLLHNVHQGNITRQSIYFQGTCTDAMIQQSEFYEYIYDAIFAIAGTFGDIKRLQIVGNQFKTTRWFAGRVSGVTSNVVSFSNIVGAIPQLGDTVRFDNNESGAVPTGLTAAVTYYVVPVNATSFSLSDTLNGAVKTLTNGTGLGAYAYVFSGGAAAAELILCDDIQIMANIVDGGCYGFSIGSCQGYEFVGNQIKNQTLYGMEAGSNYNSLFEPGPSAGQDVISDNKFENCFNSLDFSGNGQNTVISNNVMIHTTDCPRPLGSHVAVRGRNIHITGNTFINAGYRAMYTQSSLDNVVIDNNLIVYDAGRPTFGWTTPPDPRLLDTGSYTNGLVIKDNTFDCSVDGGVSGSGTGVIFLFGGANICHQNLNITGNKLSGKGLGFGTGGMIKLIGIQISGGRAQSCYIADNEISGFVTGVSETATNAVGVVFENNRVFNNATDWSIGASDVIRYSPPATLLPTALAATGDLTNGWRAIVNVSSGAAISSGMNLYINGATLRRCIAATGMQTISTPVTASASTGLVAAVVAPTSGTSIRFSTTGNLPFGLTSTDTFYVVQMSATEFNVTKDSGASSVAYGYAVSRNLAQVVAVTSAGTGTHTMVNSPTIFIDTASATTVAGVTIKGDNTTIWGKPAGLPALGRISETVSTSPSSWQNTAGYAKDAVVSGASGVTLIDLSQDGSTWSNVVTQSSTSPAIVYQRTVQPGTWMRITYTSTAPLLITTVNGA